jgi:hypothetical protein
MLTGELFDMSLKTFHIVFVSLSVVTAFFFGTWLFVTVDAGSFVLRLWFGIISYTAGVVLIVYGRYFLRKFKSFSFV